MILDVDDRKGIDTICLSWRWWWQIFAAVWVCCFETSSDDARFVSRNERERGFKSATCRDRVPQSTDFSSLSLSLLQLLLLQLLSHPLSHTVSLFPSLALSRLLKVPFGYFPSTSALILFSCVNQRRTRDRAEKRGRALGSRRRRGKRQSSSSMALCDSRLFQLVGRRQIEMNKRGTLEFLASSHSIQGWKGGEREGEREIFSQSKEGWKQALFGQKFSGQEEPFTLVSLCSLTYVLTSSCFLFTTNFFNLCIVFHTSLSWRTSPFISLLEGEREEREEVDEGRKNGETGQVREKTRTTKVENNFKEIFEDKSLFLFFVPILLSTLTSFPSFSATFFTPHMPLFPPRFLCCTQTCLSSFQRNRTLLRTLCIWNLCR